MVSRSALHARGGFPCAETTSEPRPRGERHDLLALLAVEALLLVLFVLAAVALVARSDTARLIVARIVGGGMA